jgi:hypothetical protein
MQGGKVVILRQNYSRQGSLCLVVAVLGLSGAASACSTAGQIGGPEATAETTAIAAEGKDQMTGNTARPGWVAIKQEFDAAMAADTVEALTLFIARHPDSEWTPEARRRLEALQRG